MNNEQFEAHINSWHENGLRNTAEASMSKHITWLEKIAQFCAQENRPFVVMVQQTDGLYAAMHYGVMTERCYCVQSANVPSDEDVKYVKFANAYTNGMMLDLIFGDYVRVFSPKNPNPDDFIEYVRHCLHTYNQHKGAMLKNIRVANEESKESNESRAD